MLHGCANKEILAWEYTEGNGNTNVYVWLQDHDYVAIMKKTKNAQLILLTAYWIEYNYVKRSLMKKYNARNKEANA